MSRQRRDDIQGFRGWAVILVILYVFYPKQFPNGYIGVDIYFVLSGFIVAMLLKSEDSVTLRTIGEFYQKRIHRILPSYFIAVILIRITVIIAFPDFYNDINLKSARMATMFIANFQKESVLDSMVHLVADDIFYHFWSICVELQTYALIPLIFFIQQKLIHHEVLTFSVILILSLLFHLISVGAMSYSSVAGRLWQFSAGILAFMASMKWPIEDVRINIGAVKINDETLHSIEANEKTPMIADTPSSGILANICLFTPIMVGVVPLAVDVIHLRLCVSTMTALILYLSCENAVVYCNSVIMYIGEISYTLYLAHLPVFSVVEFYYDFIYYPFPLGISITFVLAIISEQLVDGIIRSLPSFYGLAVSALFFIMAAILCY